MGLWLSRLHHHRWVISTLISGLLLTFFASFTIRDLNQHHINEAVLDSANPLFERITDRFNRFNYGLQEARTAVLAGGARYVALEDFRRFGQTLDLEESFPGSRGFGFIRRVPADELSAFIDGARADGRLDFKIQELAPHTGDHFVLQYLEPYQISTNYQAIGVDIASEPRRRETALAAMLSGDVRITPTIELSLDDSRAQNSFLMLMPVYERGVTPASFEQRNQACFGWLVAPIESDRVLDDLAPDPQMLRFLLSDATEGTDVEPFYSNSDIEGEYPLERDIVMMGRVWRFHLSVTPQYVKQLHLFPQLLITVVGILISILAAVSVNLFIDQLRSRQRLTQEQTKLHAIVESSADAIIGKTIDGTVMSWNSGAEKIFGYSADEAIGKPLKSLIIPERLRFEEDEILSRIRKGENVNVYESMRRCKDGHEIPVASTVSPIFASDGRVIGAAKTVRDISRQKNADAKIRELNTNLEHQVAQRTAELAEVNLLFKTVLAAASEFGIIATDTRGVIQFFNQGGERMLGYSAAELVGIRTPEIFHDRQELQNHAKRLQQEVGESVSGFDLFVYKAKNGRREAEYQEWTYIAKNGRRFPIRLVVTAMRDEKNDIVGYLGIASDITDEKAAQAALHEAQEQLVTSSQTLLTASRTAGLGIWQIQYSDYSVTWNDKMYELYHQQNSVEPMTFARWSAMVHPDDIESVLTSLKNASEEGVEYTLAFRVQLEDGCERIFQGASTIECSANGTPLRMIGINIDITEDRRLKQSLIEAKERADAASEAKSMFLANMSHEIRTPMNAVLGMLQLLLKTSLQPKQRDFAAKARMAATSLLSLLNDILDYSKIESGKLEIDPYPFDLNELMQHLAVVMSGNLRDKSIELLFDFDERMPPHLVGDELRIQQVLMNLLSNAIKFTDEGEVIVKTRLVDLDEGNATITISVKDTGIGISAEQQARIFDGFTQAEASITRRYGGTGLGLVICRQLVALMGGELLLSSELGKGSCFSFTLTLPVNNNIDWQPERIASQPKLLVVDDNPVSRRLATESLLRLQTKVDAVDNGDAALHLLKQAETQGEPYDCVLLDWLMPQMDGVTLAGSIRELLAPQNLPKMILLSAANHEDLPTLSNSSPFDLVLSKPITISHLAQAVTNVLAGISMIEADIAHESPSASLQGLRVLLVEDNSFNQAVATELLTGEGAEVTLAVDGQDGVNQLRQNPSAFDVVLMDMQMPKMDGLTATRLLRQDERFASLPIVAMTANVSQQDQDACRAAGMNEHLAKPLDFPEVVATLQRVTARALVPVSDADVAKDPLTKVLQRFGGNTALYRKLLVEFKQSFTELLQQLDGAINAQQWPQVQTILHTMKGTSGTAGLVSLYDAVVELERHSKQQSAAELPLTMADCVAQLTSLSTQEYQQLQQQLAARAEQDSGPVAEVELSQLLEELLESLQAGNMKAIELAEQLVAQIDDSQRDAAQQLLHMTENLQFDLALQQLKALMEQL
ncbi:PAS domain S-box protein [Shewanella sp. C32]|uniref:histidine kinase n=1 Tax=Shewanella electrica TaxID=515560 RepID=A0ABT2FHW6_9GAMM|nr:PAS domain S-box protein [Shewanella electrica]MCH1924026.1 PAS domain S-box protein [Shewanella electrica]MCS4555929.1 PAS domain S-box protein [Shewanella electrica]